MIYVLTLGIAVTFVLSAAVAAEVAPTSATRVDCAGAIQSCEAVGTVAEGHSFLDSIVEAVEDLIGEDDPNFDPPIGDVHPPDWDEPTEDPDGDDGGWEDSNR